MGFKVFFMGSITFTQNRNSSGDFRYFQCSQPCHDKLYESHDLVSAMLDNMEGLEVPAEWIPRCPECGWKMVPWVQDNTFLQGEAWQTAYQRYEDFVRKYQGKKLLLLELGVGEMTPSIIKLPFWNLLPKTKTSFMHVLIESHLIGQSICGDAACICKEIWRKL